MVKEQFKEKEVPKCIEDVLKITQDNLGEETLDYTKAVIQEVMNVSIID